MNFLDFLSVIGGCFHQITQDYGLLLSLLIAGLIGSTTHCVVMCGPFVVSQTGGMTKFQDMALIPYHLGRMTTYIVLAILAYSVFNLVFVYSGTKAFISAPMLLLAGVIFIVSAFPKLKLLFPWAGFGSSMLSHKWIGKISIYLVDSSTVLKKYLIGVFLGFMPCGLVVAALLTVATAPTLFMAIVAMGVFTLGTVPALVTVAIGGSHFSKKYPKFSLRFSQIAKVTSALWLFALAGTLIL